MTTGKIKGPKLPFYEYLNAQLAVLHIAVFKSMCIDGNGSRIKLMKILMNLTAVFLANADKLQIILWTSCTFIISEA